MNGAYLTQLARTNEDNVNLTSPGVQVPWKLLESSSCFVSPAFGIYERVILSVTLCESASITYCCHLRESIVQFCVSIHERFIVKRDRETSQIQIFTLDA